jgi:hypothetical protein
LAAFSGGYSVHSYWLSVSYLKAMLVHHEAENSRPFHFLIGLSAKF